MRVPTSLLFDQNIRAIMNNQQQLADVQESLSTGKKINRPSDDPVGAAKVLRITESLDKLTQYQRNNDLLTNSLEQQEVVLQNVNDAVQRARVLAIQAGSGILASADRKAIATEIEQIRNEVFDLMNTRNANGEYIFSGYQSQSQAYEFNPSSATPFTYLGDNGTNNVKLSDSVEVRSTVTGAQVFDNALARFDFEITGTTGATIEEASILQQGTFDKFYDNNYDLVTAANNDFRFTVLAGNQIQLTNQGTGATVATLGFTSGESFSFQGATFRFNAGVGDTVDFSLQPPDKKNIAETLNDFVNALKNDATDADLREAISDVVVGIDNAKELIGNEISSIGGRRNIATSIYETNLDLEIVNKEARSKIEDTDYAEASAEFAKQETALEATLATFPRISNLSLFNFIS
ncbi:flagellar hook-associated protein 3 [Alteromonas sediminis]|uniref:Flagellar hook-associated protein 3 n=1 Tax=Alteromonas sediminis TaxID=2259342 RepID=A0A3N5Y4D8_9ALTE|nr:flagellar hook-associated protein FlgL [Alteromonas sediminis]RPJ64959.1 flagellar hook-associated protein 3 [Alteromonas sediminis]